MSRFQLCTGDEAARSSMYRLLARIWLREVDGEFARQLSSAPLGEAFVAVGGVMPVGDDDTVAEQLATDYCQLFIGPSNHLPPFQSVWQSGQFNDTPTDSMRRFIDICGYDTSRLSRGTMLDHLGVQLNVMGQVLDQLALWTEPDATSEGIADIASAFFAAHLRWPTELLSVAERQATSEFYRSAIMLTRDFLQSETAN